MLLRILIFLILNFAALGVGGLFTSSGVTSEWYTNLNKAPWTPPGWVFGFAWTTIMIGFSIYLAYLWPQTENKSLLLMLFALQWVLNTGWNPVFFYFHQLLAGLVIIVLLTLLVGYLFFLILAVCQMDILIAFTLHHLALYSYFTERIRVFEKLSSVQGSL